MTINERRKGRKARELTFFVGYEACLFCRGMEVVSPSDATHSMNVFKIDIRNGKVSVTVPVFGKPNA